MYRLILIAAVAASLGACAVPQSGGGYASADQVQHACANAGIAPGSGRFDRCAADLNQSLTVDSNLPG
jgi:hypothetical protein